MTAILQIQYSPKIYKNFQNTMALCSSNNDIFIIPIEVYREPPILKTYIFRSIADFFYKPKLKSKTFSFKRRQALNSSIDCGSCLVTTINVLSIIFENHGNDGQFFVITEDEWNERKIIVKFFTFTLRMSYFLRF